VVEVEVEVVVVVEVEVVVVVEVEVVDQFEEIQTMN
jgi:hypothetical protein